MKRRITGVILISLGLGLFWQVLAEGLDCHTRCRQSYDQCTDLAHKAINPIRSLKYATTHITGVWGIALIDNSPRSSKTRKPQARSMPNVIEINSVVMLERCAATLPVILRGNR